MAVNQSRSSLPTVREQRLWDLQNELEALRSEDKGPQLAKIGEVVEFLYSYRGRAEQLEVLWYLLFQKKDIILVAKNSFGKSMIMQAMPCLLRGSIVLIILPLHEIRAEQEAKIAELPGTRPVHVCAETISAELLVDIRRGKYTHILLSPELLAAKKFHNILTDPTFRDHLGLVVIDEVHLVANWGGSFRSAYTRLWKARMLLGKKPWFACTATLDEATFGTVQELAGFRSDVRVIRTSIDRPELSIIREHIQKGDEKTFKGLYFVIDGAFEEEVNLLEPIIWTPGATPQLSAQRTLRTPTPLRIRKTVIFMDSKDMILLCRNRIRSWLIFHGYTEAQAKNTVQVYFSSLAKPDKDALYKEFKKPDSKIRIMVCSDALAVGVDIPDIDQSVQWGMPKDKAINMIWQRFGRAAHNSERTGSAIFLVEHWCEGPREAGAGSKRGHVRTNKAFRPQPTQLGREYLANRNTPSEDGAADFASDISSRVSVESDADSDVSSVRGGRALSPEGTSVVTIEDLLTVLSVKRPKTVDEKRAALPDCLYRIANTEKDCLRKLILGNYNEPCSSIGAAGCCSNCDPQLRAYKTFDIRTSSSADPKLRRRQPMFANIKEWVSDWVWKKYAKAFWRPIPEYLISDAQIDIICANARLLTNCTVLKQVLPDWSYERLGEDIETFLRFVQEEDKNAMATDCQSPQVSADIHSQTQQSPDQNPLDGPSPQRGIQSQHATDLKPLDGPPPQRDIQSRHTSDLNLHVQMRGSQSSQQRVLRYPRSHASQPSRPDQSAGLSVLRRPQQVLTKQVLLVEPPASQLGSNQPRKGKEPQSNDVRQASQQSKPDRVHQNVQKSAYQKEASSTQHSPTSLTASTPEPLRRSTRRHPLEEISDELAGTQRRSKYRRVEAD